MSTPTQRHRSAVATALVALLVLAAACAADDPVSESSSSNQPPADVQEDATIHVDPPLHNADECPPPNLPPETDAGATEVLFTASCRPFVRTPDARFDNLDGFPYEPHYVTVDGMRMHYVDEGPRDGEVILLLHGQPAWSYLYRKMIPTLAEGGHRVVAVDLIGMGRSDKPVQIEDYSYLQQVAWVEELIDVLELWAARELLDLAASWAIPSPP